MRNLVGLSDAQAAWLEGTMRRNRERFAGWSMELEAGESGAGETVAGEAAADEAAKPEASDLGDAGKKAIQAERDRAKAAERRASELEARVKEFEDSQKTQAEKDAERFAESERQASLNAAKVMRYEVAAKTGLPLEAAARLVGDTEESLLKDAEALKSLLAAAPAEKPTPKPDKSQASTGGSAAPKSLSEAVSAHYNA